jgi:hypothetical protein
MIDIFYIILHVVNVLTGQEYCQYIPNWFMNHTYHFYVLKLIDYQTYSNAFDYIAGKGIIHFVDCK